MAKTKQQKQEIITKLEGAMKDSVSTVFVHFSKVTVAEESGMRRALRGDSVGYTVAKKTLIRRALDTLGHAHADLPLDGEVAIAYGGGTDATAAARLMHEFGKKLQNKLSILGGIFEGKIVSAAQMQEIATIPSVQVLRGMFVNVINSPIAGLAIALKAVADKRGATN
jgi:large subunit ribosomal protein L10